MEGDDDREEEDDGAGDAFLSSAGIGMDSVNEGFDIGVRHFRTGSCAAIVLTRNLSNIQVPFNLSINGFGIGVKVIEE